MVGGNTEAGNNFNPLSDFKRAFILGATQERWDEKILLPLEGVFTFKFL